MVKMVDVHLKMHNDGWVGIYRSQVGLSLPIKYSRLGFYKLHLFFTKGSKDDLSTEIEMALRFAGGEL